MADDVQVKEPEPAGDEVEGFKMSLTEHLDELRSRLIYSLVAVFSLAIIAYIFKEPLLRLLIGPLQAAMGQTVGLSGPFYEDVLRVLRNSLVEQGLDPAKVELFTRQIRHLLTSRGLVFLHPVEAFFSYIKLSLYAGLLVGMPAIIYHLWKYVMPALYRHERKYLLNFLFFGSLLFYGGVAFAFLAILPLGLQFLIGIGLPLVSPMFSIGNYISFTMLFMLAFGLSFELPLAMFVVVKMGLVEHGTFVRQWRVVIVGAFAVGALFTPPDVFTQLAMASAMVVLYGVGLLLTRFASRRAESE